MTLGAGSEIGPYRIVAPVGKGAMGEVFLARDTRLNRDVAIKVLPEAFARDEERVLRFRREAQILASLNHPNIAAIYSLEETEGVLALALELVEGQDLAELMARGPVPLPDALSIARQIASALDDAHEQGIVHRDLKPANIRITREGKVKVLDFGLARIQSAGPVTAEAATLARELTIAGSIIGSPRYMSPEQARGQPLGKRTDIWSFGVILFEMIAGRKLFEGSTVSDVLAAVLTRDPDWSLLPKSTPEPVCRLLRQCLERDVRRGSHRRRCPDQSVGRRSIRHFAKRHPRLHPGVFHGERP